MITLGMDPHPGSHTVAALNSNGSLLCSIKVLNTSAGLDQLHQFGSQFASRRWAIEGAGNRFVAQFVNELLAKGETIYAIAPSLTSQYRCRRGTKKTIKWTPPNVVWPGNATVLPGFSRKVCNVHVTSLLTSQVSH